MNNDDEKWQWVDEDPIEKLLAGRRSAVQAESPAQLQQSTPHQAAPIAANIDEHMAEAKEPAAELDLAMSLQEAEKWEDAVGLFRRALEVNPGRLDALIGLGACLLHVDNAVEALSCFEDCLSSSVGRERALFGKAVALQKLMRYDEADRTYRELLQINPNAAEPLGNLIAMSVARQDAAAVGEYSRRLLRVDPQSKTALQGLATQALWSGDQAAAIRYCTRVLEVDPVSYEGWFNLGFAKQSMRPAEPAMRSIA